MSRTYYIHFTFAGPLKPQLIQKFVITGRNLGMSFYDSKQHLYPKSLDNFLTYKEACAHLAAWIIDGKHDADRLPVVSGQYKDTSIFFIFGLDLDHTPSVMLSNFDNRWYKGEGSFKTLDFDAYTRFALLLFQDFCITGISTNDSYYNQGPDTNFLENTPEFDVFLQKTPSKSACYIVIDQPIFEANMIELRYLYPKPSFEILMDRMRLLGYSFVQKNSPSQALEKSQLISLALEGLGKFEERHEHKKIAAFVLRNEDEQPLGTLCFDYAPEEGQLRLTLFPDQNIRYKQNSNGSCVDSSFYLTVLLNMTQDFCLMELNARSEILSL